MPWQEIALTRAALELRCQHRVHDVAHIDPIEGAADRGRYGTPEHGREDVAHAGREMIVWADDAGGVDVKLPDG